MFIKNNLEKGYVNGTLGTVTAFSDQGFPIVKTRDFDAIDAEPETWAIEDEMGRQLASFSQIPLRLAWSITIHKSQGMTLDAAVIDLSRAFERGQGYVALSRLRDLDGMKLYGFNRTALEVDSLALKADVRFQALSCEFDASLDVADLASAFKPFIIDCGGITDTSKSARNKKNYWRKNKPEKGDTYKITREYIEKNLPLEVIAKKRGLAKGTILSHLIHILKNDPEIDLDIYRPPIEIFEKVKQAASRQIETESLSLGKIYADLQEKVSYDEIRLSLLFIKTGPKETQPVRCS